MNRKEVEEDRERNAAQRLDFVIWYARWVRRTANSVWSKQQGRMLDSAIRAANEGAPLTRKGARKRGAGK